MSNQDFNPPQEKDAGFQEKERGPLLTGQYYEAQGWWFWAAGKMPEQSILPVEGGPEWEQGDLPIEFAIVGKKSKAVHNSIQGWKLHLAVEPEDIPLLYFAVSPVLRLQQVAHKFYPFGGYMEGRDSKACAIYPETPTQLAEIVPLLDSAIERTRLTMIARRNSSDIIRPWVASVRPRHGGVKGDLALGTTGVVHCRYGGFEGTLADQDKVWDPKTEKTFPDPRNIRPFPDFITQVPGEIEKLIAPTSSFGPRRY
jgi:hypothetical protein